MSEKSDLRQAMQNFLRTETEKEVYSIKCVVADIDLTTNTCDCVPLLDKPDILGVHLMPKDEDGALKKGFLLIPKIGSVVYVTMLSDDEGFISSFSEVEEIHLNGDSYEGLIKIADLVNKLNTLENKVNSIISTFNGHTHPYVNVVTPAATSVTATLVVGTLTPTQQADIENPLVKHGNGE